MVFLFIIIWFIVVIFIYGFIIVWFKDMLDMVGDEAYCIQILLIKVGFRCVFWIGNSFLGCLFFLLAIFFLWVDFQVYYLFFGLGYLSLLLGFFFLASWVDFLEKVFIMCYYQAVWGLFFLEYGLFVIVGWFV